MAKITMMEQIRQKANRNKQARKRAKKKVQEILALPVIHPDTAGIDIGATLIYVAVGADRDPEPVRYFGSFTTDLQEITNWLKQCGIRQVAMESTGVYWIALYQMLADHGLEVTLVNARHYKNVPGRKSDVLDCQWLQRLHAVGFLRGSHRPEQSICAIRTLLRHRGGLIEAAAEHVQHMQKSLEQMNVKLAHVISDLTGVTGLAIVDAILAGERSPKKLAELRDKRVKASEETIMKSLEGDYRAEHLITLRQSLELYREYQRKIEELDKEMEQFMSQLPDKIDVQKYPLPVSKKKTPPKRQHNAPAFDLRSHCYRVFGVDLCEIPGIDAVTCHVLLTEVGQDLKAFPNAGAFASWLRLCPQNGVSGGKVLWSKTGKGKNRLAMALRQAAQALHGSQTALGEYFRQMRARLDGPEAITAAAHKLARIIYHMLTTGEAYDETAVLRQNDKKKEHKIASLRRMANKFGFQLTPTPAN